MSKKLKKIQKKKPETIKLKEHFISFHSISMRRKFRKASRQRETSGPGLIYNRWMAGGLRMGRQVSGPLGGGPVLILRFSKALRAMDLEDHKT